MKTNFDLRKFLVENKLTTNSRLFKEEAELDVPDMNNPKEVEDALVQLEETILDNFAEGNGRYNMYAGVDEVASVLSNYYGPEHREFIEYAMNNSFDGSSDEENILKAAFNIVVGTEFKFDLSSIEFEKDELDMSDISEEDFATGQKYFNKYRDRLEKEGLLDGSHKSYLEVVKFAQKIRRELQRIGDIGDMESFILGFTNKLEWNVGL